MTLASNTFPWPADLTLAILAGGEGSRMGLPKGQLQIGGQPILQHLLDRSSFPGPTLLVTAPGREHPPGWQQFDREAVDPTPLGGPLRGVLTAIESCSTSLLLVLTVDMPGIGWPQCEAVLTALLSNDSNMGAMTSRAASAPDKHADASQFPGLIEPFPLALRAGARAAIESRWASGRRSVQGLAGEPGFVLAADVVASDLHAWANLNLPQDLRDFQLHPPRFPSSIH